MVWLCLGNYLDDYLDYIKEGITHKVNHFAKYQRFTEQQRFSAIKRIADLLHGYGQVKFHRYGRDRQHLIAEIWPKGDEAYEQIVITAPYSTVKDSFGATQSAAATAVMLQIISDIQQNIYGMRDSLKYRLLFVFRNDDPQYTNSLNGDPSFNYIPDMENLKYAINLESLGVFSTQPITEKKYFASVKSADAQQDRWSGNIQADYIGIWYNEQQLYDSMSEQVDDPRSEQLDDPLSKQLVQELVYRSGGLLKQLKDVCRKEGIEQYSNLNLCLSENEQWRFWNVNYNAIHITDTGKHRNLAYKTEHDDLRLLTEESRQALAKLTVLLEQMITSMEKPINLVASQKRRRVDKRSELQPASENE